VYSQLVWNNRSDGIYNGIVMYRQIFLAELCKDGIKNFEIRRVDTVKEKCRLCKEGPKMTTGVFTRDSVATPVPPESTYPRIDEYICDKRDSPCRRLSPTTCMWI